MPSPATYEATPLAAPSDLTAYGTFSEEIVHAAGQGIRRETEWHIAPQITETLLLDGDGSNTLILPTLHLVTVSAVRDVSGDTPAEVTGWRKSSSGILTLRYGYWPVGSETVEVDLVHGYETCPAELLPVLARRCRDAGSTSAGQVRLGSLSIGTTSVGTTVTALDDAIIRRYSL